VPVDPLNAWKIIAAHHEERERESAERGAALWLSVLLREMHNDLGTVVAVLAEQPYRVRRELDILLEAIQTERARRREKDGG
jgi:hypothetical protein